MALRGGRLGPGLLAEHVVGELAAPVLLDPADGHGRQLDERVARQLAHPPLGQIQHVGQLAVRLSLTQDELDDRPLLGRELLEGGHFRANCSVPAGVDPPVDSYPVPGTLDDALGFELLEASPDRVRGRFAAEKRVQQPFGLVHGGAYMALAESMASVATFQAVAGDGNIAVGQANDNHFLRPVTEGLGARRGHADPPRQDILGLGHPLHGRPGPAVRDFASDDRRQATRYALTAPLRPLTRSPSSGSACSSGSVRSVASPITTRPAGAWPSSREATFTVSPMTV